MTFNVKAGGAWHEANAGYAKVAGSWHLFMQGEDPKDMHIIEVTTVGAGRISLPATAAKYVDWGDGKVEKDLTTTPSHTYSPTGAFTVKAIFDWDNSAGLTMASVANIKQFGLNSKTGKRNQIANGTNAFSKANIANCPAVAGLDTSNLTTGEGMFADCALFNTDISGWNVSGFTSFEGMFASAKVFNRDLGDWDVSNATNMMAMFNSTSAFDQDLSGWCVAKIATAPLAFASSSALTAAHTPKWGTCPGSDPVALTRTGSGTWTVSNFVQGATYTVGTNATFDDGSKGGSPTFTITNPNAISYIQVKYANGVELRTYAQRMAYTYTRQNFPYPCGTSECNCRDEWSGCHCGRDAPCDGPSYGQCGCPAEMCWYGKTRRCDQCTKYCDDWRDVKNGTPSGFTDSDGEWWRVSTTPLSMDDVRAEQDEWTTEGVHIHSDGDLHGWFPVDYDEVNGQPVQGGAKSATVAFFNNKEIVGYFESNFDTDAFALVKFVDQGKWGYLLKCSKPEWLDEWDAYDFVILNTDLALKSEEIGVVERD